MKKFRQIIFALSFIFILLSFMVFKLIDISSERSDNTYRIEINRLTKEARENYISLVNGTYTFTLVDEAEIKAVDFLSTQETGENEIIEFYKVKNNLQMEIQPLIVDNKVVGYLRFDYIKILDKGHIYLIAELSLALIYFVSLITLLYVNIKIIKPFNKLSQMPYDLSSGNLTMDLKENKNKFFGKFIWGVNMLRDSLDTHKKHELKLAKDKKMIILSISHDIKTPLNAISLYAKTIKNGMYESKTELEKTSESIIEKANEINVFVNEIVKSSTEDVVVIDVKITDFYLKDLIEKIRSGFSEKCRLLGVNFTIDEYENILIKGDPDRLFEACGNLIENAIKYGDGKSISITFSREDNYQMISFYNSGETVLDKEMPHIFDSFFRGSNVRGKQGNGLGLFICKNIMTKCGGDIFATKKNNGMEFVLVCKES